MKIDHKNRPVSIYLLTEYGTHVPKYVGKTVQVSVEEYWDKNIKDALNNADVRKKRYVYSWIREVIGKGGLVHGEILETVPSGADWEEAEKRWIKELRDMGCPLTNLTNGGDGASGYEWREESKSKLSTTKKEFFKTHAHHRLGAINGPLHRQRLSTNHVGFSGKQHSEKTLKLMSLLRIGVPNTVEQNTKIGLAKKGKKHSLEHVENNRKAHIGQIQTDETNQKRSKSLAGKPWSAARRVAEDVKKNSRLQGQVKRG